MHSFRHSKRRGLTLMELLISLVLTGVVLVLISTAMDLHLRALVRQRATAEEGQLARSLLQRIGNDLRNAVQFSTIDMEEGLGGLDSGALMNLATGAIASGDIDLADVNIGALLGGGSEPEEPTSSYTPDLVSNLEPPVYPGLYGNQFEMQIDISRLPRVEEYHSLFLRTDSYSLVDIPSDVKTVTYYIRPVNQSVGQGSQELFQEESGAGGLVRRHLDRAVTNFAYMNGNIDGLMREEKLLAPEVVGLQFQYFDGYQWLPEWDTEIMQGLPVAVEILLLLKSDSPYQSGGVMTSLSLADVGTDLDADSAVVSYRLVVRLPVGIVPDVTEDDGMESMGL
ncbi:MAG: prepilin-type N-terminal cleavage/methylation domain-containing protein [Pirellulaceae bacterium]